MIKYLLPILLLLLNNCNPNDDISNDYNFGIRDNKVIISGYFGKEMNVIIPNFIKNCPVVTIDKDAFCNKGIKSVILPDYLEIINDTAFAYNQLTDINFPDTVSYIGGNAFGWNKLKSISIPERVTCINREAFCFNELTSVKFHDNIQSIDYLAFQRNYLVEVSLPESLTYIGSGAFTRNKIISLKIPKNISEIGNIVFSDNLLSTILIPDNIKKIREYAFANCNNLTSITFESTIPSEDFSPDGSFPGDLRDKFYADDAENGTPGTYTREADGTTWIRQ